MAKHEAKHFTEYLAMLHACACAGSMQSMMRASVLVAQPSGAQMHLQLSSVMHAAHLPMH